MCKDSADCFFSHFPVAERSRFNSLIRHRIYQKGELIFGQGAVISGLYLLCRGAAWLTHYTQRRGQYVVRLLGAGDLFGAPALWETEAASVEAQALAESMIGWLSPSDLQEILKQEPLMALEIQKRLAQEVSELYVRLAEQAHWGTRGRLVQFLLDLGKKYGRISDSGFLIDLELTEQELAEMLGCSREWVSKQMSTLQRCGLIFHCRGEIVILDEAGLQRLIAPPA
jgi:CRP/FNR family transcriptional regulator